MITPDEAMKRLLALASPVDIETLPLLEATGRWAAKTVLARRTQPARDLSAMDGYAIRHADLPGPWRVIGESAAGTPFVSQVGAGDAVRIFTGAALPDCADSIVIQEDITREGHMIALSGDSRNGIGIGTHVRPAGSDFAKGQTLIEDGARLTPARIGLAATGGHSTLPVRRRITIAIISTGDELVPLGTYPGADHMPASNAVMLAAMLKHLPVDVTDFGITPDHKSALTAAFLKAADYDIIVTTGGASVGDHDLVQPALIDAGATIDFWKIAMRPGKPLLAGRLSKAIALGLPGNPVSAFVTATLFLKPLIAHLSGAKDSAPLTLTARLASDMPNVSTRTDYVRAHWMDGAIVPLSGDSGMLTPLAAASALIIRPAGSPAAFAGNMVTVIPVT